MKRAEHVCLGEAASGGGKHEDRFERLSMKQVSEETAGWAR